MGQMCMTDAGTTQDNFFLLGPPVGGLPISQDWLDRIQQASCRQSQEKHRERSRKRYSKYYILELSWWVKVNRLGKCKKKTRISTLVNKFNSYFLVKRNIHERTKFQGSRMTRKLLRNTIDICVRLWLIVNILIQKTRCVIHLM